MFLEILLSFLLLLRMRKTLRTFHPDPVWDKYILYAMIGVGAVVTKEVKPYALLIGNPARQLGWVSEYGHKLSFDENGLADCPESKQRYVLKDNRVQKL